MNEIVTWFDNQPLWLKLILALPVLDLSWMIYRICLSLSKNNTSGVILGIFLIILGLPWIWLIDMITLITNNKVIWID